MLAKLENSILVVVDMQPSFLDGIHHREQITGRVKFIVESARLLEIPIVATEQNPDRMGAIEESIAKLLDKKALSKMTFSCCGVEPFTSAIDGFHRNQVVLVGIETHICISQTAHDLLGNGYEPIVCTDAVSARTIDRHRIGVKRLRDAGVTIAHTESVAYEWTGSADNPKFRDVLKLVKKYA
ncbi:MAG: isochorismatase family protein [Armatimonadetes bacterium]|nr:isochorismatase family protein [Armatimonadota bacterium]